ncbi:MAG TPA: hypothetical protein VFE51_20150 [Verrucomicrobiae bacterium]|nr:hypothetical protein [Verrucomicrobiae bacterium]
MIALAKDCLLFQLSNGERVPFSVDMISVEFTAETASWLNPDTACHAAVAVFHYFKRELGRHSVTAEEFAAAMERALRGISPRPPSEVQRGIVEDDLRRLALEAGDGCELLFFPRLRDEMREHLRKSPRLLRYRGLRECVKQIARVRRWTPRCRELQEQIVNFVRECAGMDSRQSDLQLVVE